jgi:hypothetical protein
MSRWCSLTTAGRQKTEVRNPGNLWPKGVWSYASKGNHYGRRPSEGFVMVCQSPSDRLGGTFSLKGWQRRRLVPLHHTERESQEIVAGALLTQNHLFTSPPRFAEEADDTKPSPSAGIDVNAA